MPESTYTYRPYSGAAEYDALTPGGTGPAANPNAGQTGGFWFTTTTAVNAVAAATSTVPVIYNPTTSHFIARIQIVKLTDTSTLAAGGLYYGYTLGATFSSVTNGPAPINSYLNGSQLGCPFAWYTTATCSATPTLRP